MSDDGDQLKLYYTPNHSCSYFGDRVARTIVADPEADISPEIFTRLSQLGFRRSSDQLYRPNCEECSQCISVRIPVNEFKPSRRFRRVLNTNKDLSVSVISDEFRNEHYALYLNYLRSRHPDGNMKEMDEDDYQSFMRTQWSRTKLVEIRDNQQLLGVAITDTFNDGLSAMYTYYRTDLPKRSLGHFAILQQIDLAKSLELPYLYLGFWIKDSPEMRYKLDYRPIELFDGQQWHALDKNECLVVE